MTEAIEKFTDRFGMVFIIIPGYDHAMGRCTVIPREWTAVMGTTPRPRALPNMVSPVSPLPRNGRKTRNTVVMKATLRNTGCLSNISIRVPYHLKGFPVKTGTK